MTKWTLPEGRKPMTDTDIAALTRRLAGTAVDYKELYEAAKRDAEEAEAYAKELEAKLEKAVEAMQEAIRLADQPHYGDRGDALDHCFDAIDVIRTTLAGLEGETDE